MVRHEPNARFHLLASVLVCVLGFVCGLKPWEWLAIMLAIGLVWTAEAMNSAVEALGDCITAEPHPGIGRAKDLAAGAVLLASFAAVGVGLIVFVPEMLKVMGWLFD